MNTKLTTLRSLVGASLILLALGTLNWLPAANPAIGMAVANGSFQVDHSRVWGNTTLFSGSIIETATASSQLQISGGVQMRLAGNSRATVYQNRLVLDAGFGQLESAAGYEVEAGTLLISPLAGDTVARIRLNDDRKVTVAAVRGSVRVANGTGLLVANVLAGSSLDFDPQVAGAAAPTRISGCLVAKAGKFLVFDQTTNVVLEVQGAGLAQNLGNRVEVIGKAEATPSTAAGASQVVTVASMKQIGKGGCTAVAKKLGATTAVAAGAAGAAAAGAGGAAGAAGAASGISLGTVAVIGGVATAATVGGLAAVGSLPGQGEPSPSVSR